jgi:SAM-dependent methyltransferase
MELVKVNIGAGLSRIPGFINVDISPRADVVIDLNEQKLPFEDNSVDLIFSYHTLEHLRGYLFALSEIHRVLKHGGVFLLGVPYLTETRFNLPNPFHVQHFNEYSFDYFDPKKLKGSAIEGNQVMFEKVFHRYHYIGVFKFLPPPLSGFMRSHLLNVVRKIDYGLVAVKQGEEQISLPTASMLKGQFLACTMSRVPYDKVEKGSLYMFARGVWRWWNGNSMEV